MFVLKTKREIPEKESEITPDFPKSSEQDVRCLECGEK